MSMKRHDPCESKPYNRYIIYYILEQERYLQSYYNYKRETATEGSAHIITGYEPRYLGLDLPFDWYMPGEYFGGTALSFLRSKPTDFY